MFILLRLYSVKTRAKVPIMTVSKTIFTNKSHKILSIRHINHQTFALRFEKGELTFLPGQYLQIGLKGETEHRAFSIYSAIQDDYFELVIKMVEGGEVSGPLYNLQVGDEIDVKEPAGLFTLDASIQHKKIIFIASGTGISPFHSIIKSHEGLDYNVIHGVRTLSELIEPYAYNPKRFISCTSRDHTGQFSGRITKYLSKHPIDQNAEYFLCGNGKMIEEVKEILAQENIPAAQIHTEVFF